MRLRPPRRGAKAISRWLLLAGEREVRDVRQAMSSTQPTARRATTASDRTSTPRTRFVSRRKAIDRPSGRVRARTRPPVDSLLFAASDTPVFSRAPRPGRTCVGPSGSAAPNVDLLARKRIASSATAAIRNVCAARRRPASWPTGSRGRKRALPSDLMRRILAHQA